MSEDRFEQIRPYRDDEVRPVLERLLRDPEFLDLFGNLMLPRLHRFVPVLTRWLVRRAFRKEVAGIDSVARLQDRVEEILSRVLQQTSEGFEAIGVENIPHDQGCLFISNHRDIVLDPALINYALYHQGLQTVHCAIGDNLLSKPFAADLMRLNKSFIVKRSAKGAKELLRNSQLLSDYIRDRLEHSANVWIAQSEGRAKDGMDRTDPAVIKMLLLAYRRDALELTEAVRRMNLIPVAISYEYDPCDERKAVELDQIARLGRYEKAPFEDLTSIAAGVQGQKGRIRLVFGKPLSGTFSDPDQVATAIDRQIIANYALFPPSWIAWRELQAEGATDLPASHDLQRPDESAEDKRGFLQRCAKLTPGQRSHFLRMYANPLLARQQLDAASVRTDSEQDNRGGG
ncbi:MAG: 1-acyl-sn-glycerol-3-phosphate acyltransferase [Pseudomonadales bacterium]|nr:1-acyl-sn-glycerol-3-phosphate acyltransferase [Pseudomonadales bacterium]MCP5333970.1 1-acyl-sn-glycerol-3-phosphate acyltransferase [Pseudomonadales bacterium]